MNELCLQQCLSLIEEKLGWGTSADWLNQDFQLLSDRIFEETRVRLSITTLKRVWGKVNYDSAPSISTLNALALFLGHDNWSTFKQQTHTSKSVQKSGFKYSKLAVAIVLFVLVASTAALLAFSGKGEMKPYTESELSNVDFSSAPVTLGLPNSVVFKYDYADLGADDTYIQQSWNDKFTFNVDPTGKEATGIYYYPGYYRAKLVANGQILREHDVHIRTDGWMATIGDKDIPRYLYKHEIRQEGLLGLSESTLTSLYAKETEEPALLTYHYFDDFGQVPGDDFVFETRFRGNYEKSNGICQKTNIVIHGKDGVIIVPFSIPGCISDLRIFAMGLSIDGKSNDLSAFGTDMHNWQYLKCVAKGRDVQIYLNDQLIREFTSPAIIGDVIGFKYRFLGAGEVNYVKLTGPNGVVLEESFLEDKATLSEAFTGDAGR